MYISLVDIFEEATTRRRSYTVAVYIQDLAAVVLISDETSITYVGSGGNLEYIYVSVLDGSNDVTISKETSMLSNLPIEI